MSVECFVFVHDYRLPTLTQWQAALDRAETGVVLDKIENLREHTGYIPASFRSQESGFEWFYGPIEENYGGEAPHGIEDRTHAINFVTHSDMRELVCGMVAAAVLAQISDGLVLDEESGKVMSGDVALQVARNAEKHVK